MRLLILLLLLTFTFPALAQETKKESVYDRIMRTNTIRCGYYIWPPFLDKDVNTAKISGIAYDMTEEIGKQLGLKVEWTAEINFDSMFEGYVTGRYDLICAPLSATPSRARASDFTNHFGYFPYYLYAKEGDMRFENDYTKANVAAVKYASLEGDMNAILGNEVFPLTEKLSLAQTAGSTDPLMAVATGKADIATLEPVAALGFMRANPGKIRRVAGPPVRVLSLSYSVPIGEERLKAMLNTTLEVLLNTGFIDRAFKVYPDYDAEMLRIVPDYVMPAGK